MQDSIALSRLLSMGDWLELEGFDASQLLDELDQFSNHWKPYNPRKKNHRFGLSVTSLNGSLDGVPDLDSLYQYNREYGTNYKNSDFTKLTPVFHKCPTLQKILNPFLPWLGRCHFLRLDEGGFFPEHYDINKIDDSYNEVRLIGFVQNNSLSNFKFCYDNQLLTFLNDGKLFYFNANKHHSVFSMCNDSIQLIVTLNFNSHLFIKILEKYIYA